MNILVWTHSGNCISRPDTTWKRDNTVLYVPEDVDTVLFAPALVCRVDRPGKSVGLKFACRYYTSLAPAVLLYPIVCSSDESVAASSCMDKTSFFPYPSLDRGVCGEMRVSVGDSFVYMDEVDSSLLDGALAGVTLRCYVRSGDLLLRELAPRSVFCSRSDCRVEASMEFCGEKFDFEIKY